MIPVKYYADLVCDGVKTLQQVERSLRKYVRCEAELELLMDQVRKLVSERKKGNGKAD